MSISSNELYSFDRFRLEAAKRRLWRDEAPVTVAPVIAKLTQTRIVLREVESETPNPNIGAFTTELGQSGLPVWRAHHLKWLAAAVVLASAVGIGGYYLAGSYRTGVEELWLCDAEGKIAARQFTRAGSASGSPRWSDDGKWIAFDSYISGDGEIYVTSATGGPWRRLTFEKSVETQPAWSRDGKSLYFKSNRTGSFQIHKMSVMGGEGTEARQITFNGGFEGFESPDGKLFYYTKPLHWSRSRMLRSGGLPGWLCRRMAAGCSSPIWNSLTMNSC